ncbi:DNA polymerase III subunit beta [Neorickettsia risticii]|uniref:Beta sliding clamp n=1 Tax=Neorickettsia risticii (strain Illinois) TaxID=434131 RepID=C6V443_NEORI|nr:DNA polymerase III subunit beta [Neorickettsia risticii]ACT69160.1 DNA polymerase III, beta subunit [Neorickettsia risticii str. Illinois]
MKENTHSSITVQQDALTRILGNLVSVSTRKSTIAYLSHVRVRFTGTSVELTTTDNELSLTDSLLGIEGVIDAAISVDAFRLYEIVKRLPTDVGVVLSIEKDNLVVRSKRIEFSLPYLDAKHFPLISEEEKIGQINFAGDEIRSLFNKVRFATSNESTRQHLNGVYFESDGEKITVAATDVHRLAVATLTKKTGLKFSCIIPKKTVSEMIKLSSSKEVELFLHGREYISRIKMVFGSVRLNSKLIAGTFPNFAAVIPQSFKSSLTFDRKALATSIERVGLVSPDQSRAISIGIKGKQLYLDASNSDASFGRELLELNEDTGEEISIYFNHVYLLDILSALDNKEVTMKFNNATSQVLFQGDESALYVVMPMAF